MKDEPEKVGWPAAGTHWTTLRGVEAMDHSYGLLDMTVYGRQETWEDSPAGWPQRWEVSTARAG